MEGNAVDGEDVVLEVEIVFEDVAYQSGEVVVEDEVDGPQVLIGPFFTAYLRRKALLTQELTGITLSDMKTSTLTIRLDKDLNDLLTKASRRSGKNRSEVAREALRRQLRISQFEALRRKIMPFAEARGYLTDDDVFAEVS